MHTPGPWRVTHDGYISSDNGYVPMVTPFREDAHRDKHRNPTPEAMANAEFVVLAVNSHPALLEALEGLLREMRYIPGLKLLELARKQARETIREAKGE